MTLLITADEVIKLSFVEGKNFIRSKIKDTMILTAQYNWIKPVLGDEFYASLLTEVSNDSLGSDNEILLDNYIKPCLAYYVKYSAMPDLMLQLTNKGGQKANSEYSDTITASERGEKREAAKATADTLRTVLVDYLNANATKYPNYSTSVMNGKKAIRGGILLSKRRKRAVHDELNTTFADTSSTKTYSYQADESGFFEIDFSDIKASGEQIDIIVKNTTNQLIDEFDIDVNFDTANQTLEAWINTENEADYSGTITITVKK